MSALQQCQVGEKQGRSDNRDCTTVQHLRADGQSVTKRCKNPSGAAVPFTK